MAHGDNMMARLQAATGNQSATMLLMRLIFWHKKGQGRQLDGKKWVANSIADWATETGLTVQQVRTGFKVIGDTHLAETRLAMYATRRTLHSRPTQRAEAIAEGVEGEEFPSCEQQAPVLEATGDHVSGNTQPCCSQHAIQGDTQEEINKKSMGGVSTPHQIVTPETGKDSGMLMKDALVKAKQKTNAKIHKPDTMSLLVSIWKKKVSAETGQMVVLLKKQEMLLYRFAKLVPPNQADMILGKVLDNWIGFAKRAESLAGAKHVPAHPAVGFLLEHASVAILFASPPVQASATYKPSAPNTPKAKSDQPVQLISHCDDDDPEISYEETVAILKGAKNG